MKASDENQACALTAGERLGRHHVLQSAELKRGAPTPLADYESARVPAEGLTHDTLAGLVAAYEASPEFEGLAQTTRTEWSRYLELIRDTQSPVSIGSLPAEVLANFRVKRRLFAWRDQWRTTPRKADYALQVLSGVLSWSVDRGVIASNVLLGHATLYKNNRADVIWTDDDVARFVAAAPSAEVGFIVRLACLTGLRRADLVRLAWSDVGDVAITIMPQKSQRRRTPKKAIIPLMDETQTLLEEIREQQGRRWEEIADKAISKRGVAPPPPLTVLSNTRARSWSANGAEHQIVDTKHKAGIHKHLHDCRGTFATRLRLQGIAKSKIADVLGWTEDRVEQLMAVYVDKDRVTLSVADELRAKSATPKV